jgi:DNA polymerase I-like protein with 3'-5' exonuclease and polymerase domains
MNLIGFDLETWGLLPEYALQPWRALQGQAGVRVANGVLNPTREQVKQILDQAAEKNVYLAGWNITFDASWCIAIGLRKEVFAANWIDGMLLWRHLEVEREDDDTPKDKRRSWSLETALKRYFPEDAGFKAFTDFQTEDPEKLKELVKRNLGDLEFSARLCTQFFGALNPRQQTAALIEARCIPLVAWANVHGLCINQEATDLLDETLEKAKAAALDTLQAESPEVTEKIIASSQQLGKLLFETWGLQIHKRTDKGANSTDKESLYELAFSDPRAALVKDIREAGNCRTKFVTAVKKALDYSKDGKVHPNARIFSAYTSRMTYSSKQKAKMVNPKGREVKVERPVGAALHQWKRGAEYRRQIEAPEGHTLVELDFAGQEFRWMAVASGDPTMLALCAPGEDAHSYMGAQIACCGYRDLTRRIREGEKEATLQRNLGKFANLSFQYRISAKAATAKARVQYELNVLEPFVAAILGTYKQTFPGVPEYWRAQIFKGKSQGFAETFAGRRVQLKGDWTGRTKWPLESTAINYPIQGTGGDQKYLALAVARNHLARWNAHLYFELHDGLFFIVPDSKAEAFAQAFKELLSNLPYRAAWGFDSPTCFPVDAKLGKNWGDLKIFLDKTL